MRALFCWRRLSVLLEQSAQSVYLFQRSVAWHGKPLWGNPASWANRRSGIPVSSSCTGWIFPGGKSCGCAQQAGRWMSGRCRRIPAVSPRHSAAAWSLPCATASTAPTPGAGRWCSWPPPPTTLQPPASTTANVTHWAACGQAPSTSRVTRSGRACTAWTRAAPVAMPRPRCSTNSGTPPPPTVWPGHPTGAPCTGRTRPGM